MEFVDAEINCVDEADFENELDLKTNSLEMKKANVI